MCSKTQQVSRAAMAVSAQTCPFNHSCPSILWVSSRHAHFPSSSSSLASACRSRHYSIIPALSRQDMRILSRPCGAPNYKLSNNSIQLRRHSSNYQLPFQNDAQDPPRKPSLISHYQPNYQKNPPDHLDSSRVRPSFISPDRLKFHDHRQDHSDSYAVQPSSVSPYQPRYQNNSWDPPVSSVKKPLLYNTGQYGKGVVNNVVCTSALVDEEDISTDSPTLSVIDLYPLGLVGDRDGWKNAGRKHKEKREEVLATLTVSKFGQVFPGVQDESSCETFCRTDTVQSTPIGSKKQLSQGLVKDASRKHREVNGSSIKQVDVEKVNGAVETHIVPIKDEEVQIDYQEELQKRLCSIYDNVLVVDTVSAAEKVVSMLTNEYRHLVHACDTEVSKIDIKQETPVDHGEITCFSIYSGEGVDFGNGKSCVWVDVLDGGGKELLTKFKAFFEDSSIKKVWHNYSFDCHVIENYGIKVSGFYADTMHMARLWDSSRRSEGGYSLEALTADRRVMSRENGKPWSTDKFQQAVNLLAKVSYKTLFGRPKVKKDGSLGKTTIIASVEDLQRVDRKPWICYSCLDAIKTLDLYDCMKSKLSGMPWIEDGRQKEINGAEASMLDFYEYYWRPFGELLVKMETEGMLVNRAYLAEMEKVAMAEQQAATVSFRNWASRYCPDARYMNVGSDTQLRQLFFGGIMNRKNPNECLPVKKTFKVPNVDKVIEEGKKSPTKLRNITLHRIDCNTQIGGSLSEAGTTSSHTVGPPLIKTDLYTLSGWPSVSGDVLKALAGKVSSDDNFGDETCKSQFIDELSYGAAYAAFGKGKEGREACHAIAALCKVCSIDSLISNFILPLQGSHVAGKSGRVHCSLNINTETGRLSARRPNLQNQPALEKDRYKIRQAFIAAPGNSLIVADYGQLELRILAHLADCKSMKEAFKAGGDFHSRTAMNMYPYICEAVEKEQVLLEWHPRPGESKPPVPLLKDTYGSERRKAKMLNFSIAYGKTVMGLAKDWKVSMEEARETVNLWYKERQEVLGWQEARKKEASLHSCVYTLLGRCRRFPCMSNATPRIRSHIERAAINTPVQGSAADVAMCAMLEIAKNVRLQELGWKLLLQVHDEVILEGPTESAEEAKGIVVECMSKPFDGKNILRVDLVVDAKCAQNWYAAK